MSRKEKPSGAVLCILLWAGYGHCRNVSELFQMMVTRGLDFPLYYKII